MSLREIVCYTEIKALRPQGPGSAAYWTSHCVTNITNVHGR